MSRNKSDYKKNQGSGLRTGREQLYLNQEIDIPFFGHLDEAIKRHEEKIRITSKVGGRVAIGSAHGNLGYVDYKRDEQQQENLGNLDDAIKRQAEKIRIPSKVGDSRGCNRVRLWKSWLC